MHLISDKSVARKLFQVAFWHVTAGMVLASLDAFMGECLLTGGHMTSPAAQHQF